MNRLNRTIEYSLMALKHIAEKPQSELTTAKEVAEKYRAPFDATARVLQLMAQHGIVKVEHGAFGGYQLARDLKEVSLHELISIIQGPPKLTKCMQDEECESVSVCNIISPVTNLNKKLDQFYKSQSLLDLILGGSRNV